MERGGGAGGCGRRREDAVNLGKGGGREGEGRCCGIKREAVGRGGVLGKAYTVLCCERGMLEKGVCGRGKWGRVGEGEGKGRRGREGEGGRREGERELLRGGGRGGGGC